MPRIRLATDPVFRKRPKRETDARHLDFVRGLPCALCRRPGPSECHHLLRGVVRGMGLKAGDRWVIPLCYECHTILHWDGNETRFLDKYGVHGPRLARRIYEASGDSLEAMRAIRTLRTEADREGYDR